MMIMKLNPTREWDENKKDKEDIPISPKFMRLSTTYTYTSKGPYLGVKKGRSSYKKEKAITYV